VKRVLTLASSLLAFLFLSGCKFWPFSDNIDGFRDLKLGSSIEQTLKTKTCDGAVRTKQAGFDVLNCYKVDIGDASFYLKGLFFENKLSRIVIMLGVPDEELAGKIYDGLVSQYGKAINVDKLTFQLNVKNAKSSLKLNFGKYVFTADWKNSTVQLFTDGESLLLFYQAPEMDNIIAKSQGKGMNI
jgi:hypothetical protein